VVTVSVNKLLKVIKSFCLDCVGGNKAEVKKCSAPKCSLYPHRMGKKKTDSTDDQE
jgi:hypothetical protein